MLSLDLMQEKGKTTGASPRRGSSSVQQNSSTPVFNTPVPCLGGFPEWGCYPQDHSSSSNHVTVLRLQICFAVLSMAGKPHAPVQPHDAAQLCCTAALLRSWAGSPLLVTRKDPLRQRSQELGWKVLATANADDAACLCLLLPIGKSEAY